MSNFNLFPPSLMSDLEMDEDYISEEVFLSALTEKVAYLMDKKLDFFLSLLYRLDVKEVDIKKALLGQDTISPPRALATLILERQKNRWATRQKYKNQSTELED